MKIHNFSAGPAVLPKTVLLQVQQELVEYQDSGCSVMELSHRSPHFERINQEAQDDLRKLLNIPSNYRILFMQGGATTQFATIVYNLVDSLDKPVDYIVSGTWSDKASQEAKRLGVQVNVVATTKPNHDGILPELKFSPNPSYIYYCDNETVHGVEMETAFVNQLPKNVPIVCDMSSNLLSRQFDVSKYGVIYGGAQKNIGPAGVTIVIVREDLIRDPAKSPFKVPIMLDYKTCNDNNSLYNTPPTFAIYVSGLVFKHVLGLGGVQAMEQYSDKKSKLIYDTILKYPSVYSLPVKTRRSRMNVPFRVIKDGQPNQDLEKQFLKGAEERGMIQLKGHRSVGGIRASLYNALEMESVQALADFMEFFAKQ
ncbi:pyridoxal phosphate-dependent transferase [Gorgonomyces haynaldii]|nr:pyridoxal phosphate-dependent transferase [Gorgonomyces haynaldii]